MKKNQLKNQLLITCFMLFSYTAMAQYSIKGKIYSYGKPVAGAHLHIENNDVEVIADSEGRFEITDLEPGIYLFKIHSKGHEGKEGVFTLKEKDLDIGEIDIKKDLFELNQVIVSATRDEVSRRDAPVASNIVSAKDFKQNQSVTLLEGVSFQPALRIESNCQNCGESGIRMNGMNSSYSQILIDGRPIFSSLQGVYGLEQIPANIIERVEVIRSGGSALYGSSAIAGSINVITKEPDYNQFYLSTNQGRTNGKSADQSYMIGSNTLLEEYDASLSLNAFIRNRDPWDANGDGFSELGLLQSNAFQAKSNIHLTEFSKITLTSFSIYEHRRGGNRFDLPYHFTDITEATSHFILNGGASGEITNEEKSYKLSSYLNYQYLDRSSYYGAQKNPDAYGTSVDLNFVGGVQYAGDLEGLLGENNRLVAGLEYNNQALLDKAPSYNRVIDQKIKILGLYFQDTWKVANTLSVLVGGRLDKHSLVDDAIFSPRANILYKVTKDLQWRVGYAVGYLAPQAFDEDFHISIVQGEGVLIVNSPDLKPEYSHSYSTALDYTTYFDWVGVGLSVDAFYTSLVNSFALENIGEKEGNMQLQRRNTGFAFVKGVTINPKFMYKNIFTLQAGLTIQQNQYDRPVQWSEQIENNDKNFFRSPNLYGYYTTSYIFESGIGLYLSGVYTGPMLLQHFEGYIEKDEQSYSTSFFEHNLKMDYTINLKNRSKITLSAGVKNALNSYQKDFDKGEFRDSAYIYGPSRPRSYFVSLQTDF